MVPKIVGVFSFSTQDMKNTPTVRACYHEPPFSMQSSVTSSRPDTYIMRKTMRKTTAAMMTQMQQQRAYFLKK